MKRRLGFVSNSSSSSFIIVAGGYSYKQWKLISSHLLKARRMFPDMMECVKPGDEWTVTRRADGSIMCSTEMTNFDLISFCHRIGVMKYNMTVLKDGL